MTLPEFAKAVNSLKFKESTNSKYKTAKLPKDAKRIPKVDAKFWLFLEGTYKEDKDYKVLVCYYAREAMLGKEGPDILKDPTLEVVPLRDEDGNIIPDEFRLIKTSCKVIAVEDFQGQTYNKVPVRVL